MNPTPLREGEAGACDILKSIEIIKAIIASSAIFLPVCCVIFVS
jgi:hypothetical protein